MEGSPEEVWRFYNKRACVENMIKEDVLGQRRVCSFVENRGYFALLGVG
jgi:hypothetical protein